MRVTHAILAQPKKHATLVQQKIRAIHVLLKKHQTLAIRVVPVILATHVVLLQSLLSLAMTS